LHVQPAETFYIFEVFSSKIPKEEILLYKRKKLIFYLTDDWKGFFFFFIKNICEGMVEWLRQ
jgi:hypothetical protein